MAITITRPKAKKAGRLKHKKPRKGSARRARGTKRLKTTTIVRT